MVFAHRSTADILQYVTKVSLATAALAFGLNAHATDINKAPGTPAAPMYSPMPPPLPAEKK